MARPSRSYQMPEDPDELAALLERRALREERIDAERESLAVRLRRWRRRKRLTRIRAVQMLDIQNENTLLRLESPAMGDIYLSTLIKLADGLGCDTWELLHPQGLVDD